MRALAIRDGEDEELDGTIRRFYNAVLGKCKNNRKAPLFQRYFPEGMFPVVNAPLENELMKVDIILSKLKEEEDQELAAYAGVISSAADGLQSAMDQHSAALTSEANAFGLVQVEKINWLDTYKLDHRTLSQLYYREAKKADSYFKPTPKGKKGEEPPAPATPKV